MSDAHQRIEPTAAQRTLAKSLVGLYVALVQEGMPPDEARDLLARWAANTDSSGGDDD